MATFYVLPSRYLLGQRFSELLMSLFPGVDHTPWDWPDLAEALAAMINDNPETYVVYREDFDDNLTVRDGLLRDFGAELDDDIIEVQVGPGLSHFLHQQWSTERRAA